MQATRKTVWPFLVRSSPRFGEGLRRFPVHQLRSWGPGTAPPTAVHPLYHHRTRARLSSTTAASAKTAKPKKDDSNVFLDNLGTIFLGGIGLLIASLVRSFRGSTNRNKMREKLQEQAMLDPLEIDDLRVANSELTLTVYRKILQDLLETYPDQSLRYADFVNTVRTTMKGLKGDAFTIELGHLIDRIVLASLKQHGHSSEDAQPLAFWMAVLTLCLNGTVPERIRALYEALEAKDEGKVTLSDVREMVGYLQDTCQLVPDSQVVMSEQKYPVQQYERGVPGKLFEWDGSDEERLDIDAFTDVLRSRAVCVWGECYHRKRLV